MRYTTMRDSTAAADFNPRHGPLVERTEPDHVDGKYNHHAEDPRPGLAAALNLEHWVEPNALEELAAAQSSHGHCNGAATESRDRPP